MKHSPPGSIPSLESSLPLCRPAGTWGAQHGPVGHLSKFKPRGSRPFYLVLVLRGELEVKPVPRGVGWSCLGGTAWGPGGHVVSCYLQTSSNAALVASGWGAAADIPLTCDLATGAQPSDPS